MFTPHRNNPAQLRKSAVLSIVFGLTILLPSCMWQTVTRSDHAAVEAKKAQAEAMAYQRARENKARAIRLKKQREQDEYRQFVSMKKAFRRDLSLADAYPGRSSRVSKSLFAKEMLAVQDQLDIISQRVEVLSARIPGMPPMKPEPKAATTKSTENTHDTKAPSKAATAKPKNLMAKKTKDQAKSSEKEMAEKPKAADEPATPFWGVQIGAYRTRPGAEVAWGDLLVGPFANHLSDSKVRYVPSKPLRNGNRLTLIVIDQFDSRDAADHQCEALKGKGMDCVAYHVKP